MTTKEPSVDKEELERELEKCEKGAVITIINQTSKPLHFESQKHQHGKFKSRLQKVVSAKETASFSMEGKKAVEASVKMRWDKEKLELLWNFPETGDPKIYYKVAPTLKDKLHVYIPSAYFGRICKVIFLIDEHVHHPFVPDAALSTPRASDISENSDKSDKSDKDESIGDAEMNHSNSAGDINTVTLTPRILDSQHSKPELAHKSHTNEDEDESVKTDPSSLGGDFSSDEEDEPKKIVVVIKPKEDSISTPSSLISPIVMTPPSVSRGGSTDPRRRRTAGANNAGPSPTAALSPTHPDFLGLDGSSFTSPPVGNRDSRSVSFSGPYDTPMTPVRAMSFSASSDDFDVRGNGAAGAAAGAAAKPAPFANDLFMASTLLPSLASSPSPLSLSPSQSPSPSPIPHSGNAGAQLNSRSKGKWESGQVQSRSSSVTKSTAPTSSSSSQGSSAFPQANLAPSHPTTPPKTNSGSSLSPFNPSSRVITSSPSRGGSLTSTPLTPSIKPQPSQPQAQLQTPLTPSKSPIGSPASVSPVRALSLHTSKTPPAVRNNTLRVSGDGTSVGFSPQERSSSQRRFSEPPPVDPAILFGDSAPPRLHEPASDVVTSAKKYMAAAMNHLDNDSIQAALGNLDLCVSLLGRSFTPINDELEYCMRYKYFLNVLKELTKTVKPPLENAFLSVILTEIPVKPVHRVIALRMAIRYNFEAGNYGAAAHLIQFLIDHIHPIDEPKLQEKLRVCNVTNKVNTDPRFFKYICPACDSTSNLTALKCAHCQHPVKVCATSYEIITTKAFYTCKLCKLAFSRKAVSPKDNDLKCPMCKIGDLTNKIFAPVNNGK